MTSFIFNLVTFVFFVALIWHFGIRRSVKFIISLIAETFSRRVPQQQKIEVIEPTESTVQPNQTVVYVYIKEAHYHNDKDRETVMNQRPVIDHVTLH